MRQEIKKFFENVGIADPQLRWEEVQDAMESVPQGVPFEVQDAMDV